MTTGTPVVVSRIQNRRGTQAQFDALYPIYPNPDKPSALQPGELALITDSPGRVFMGTPGGFYVELSLASSSTVLTFIPVQVALPPTGALWSPIPALNTTGTTPFYSILYSITDVISSPGVPAPANNVGIKFSKNGELQITAISFSPGYVSLTDTGTDINAYASPYDINFKADYAGPDIQISYMHDFPVSLTFSTSSITWISL